MIQAYSEHKIFGLWAFSPRGKRADNTQPDGLGYGIMPLWGMGMVHRRGMGVMRDWGMAMVNRVGVGMVQSGDVDTSFAPKGQYRFSRPTELNQQAFAPKGQYPIAQPTGLGQWAPQNASPERGQSVFYLTFTPLNKIQQT